jgi:fructuronate reductase
MDGTQKVAVRWLPALRERLDQGATCPWLERALAAWLHTLMHARSDAGHPLTVSDPGAAALAAELNRSSEPHRIAQAALAHAPVFGAQPWPDALAQRLARHLVTLRQGGTDALLSALA